MRTCINIAPVGFGVLGHSSAEVTALVWEQVSFLGQRGGAGEFTFSQEIPGSYSVPVFCVHRFPGVARTTPCSPCTN